MRCPKQVLSHYATGPSQASSILLALAGTTHLAGTVLLKPVFPRGDFQGKLKTGTNRLPGGKERRKQEKRPWGAFRKGCEERENEIPPQVVAGPPPFILLNFDRM